MSEHLVDVATGVRLNVKESGEGEPLLLIMGTSGSLGLWAGVEAPLAERHRVIANLGDPPTLDYVRLNIEATA